MACGRKSLTRSLTHLGNIHRNSHILVVMVMVMMEGIVSHHSRVLMLNVRKRERRVAGGRRVAVGKSRIRVQGKVSERRGSVVLSFVAFMVVFMMMVSPVDVDHFGVDSGGEIGEKGDEQHRPHVCDGQ